MTDDARDLETFAREFYALRASATESSIRWTGDEMLAFDLEVLRPHLRPTTRLLDLGCGTGDIAIAVLDDIAEATLVDMVPDFVARVPDDPRITTAVATVTEYRPAQQFDVAILFGVVTHLSRSQEHDALRTLKEAAPGGTVIVKHQCGIEGDVTVDTFSESAGTAYKARYPGIDAQVNTLREYFGEVEVVRYPAHLNKWPETAHVAFVCR